jgi:DNA-binding CsgD family transcriptional regulator
VLLGRRDERARIEDLLEGARSGRSGALVIRGEPGIGKTTLLRYARDLAEGITVLSATGVESEAKLEYSGLLELIRPLLEDLEDLPVHQADVIREALGLSKPLERDRFAIGAALLSLLAAAAEKRALLVVVDDAQWFDYASADALRFAARRLLADRVAVLVAVRDDSVVEFDAPGFGELLLEGLDLDSTAALLERVDGPVMPRASVRRLHESTRGNPLALVEVRRMIDRGQLSNWASEHEPVPLASRLEHAFAQSFCGLESDVRDALIVLAVAGVSQLETVYAALSQAGVSPPALERAEDEGLINISDGCVSFRHPLVHSAVYQAASPSQRRAAHRAVAAALPPTGDVALRAWHLAAAALGPDERVADALALTAVDARARNAYAGSTAALEAAARLTLTTAKRLGWLGQAAEDAFDGGMSAHALELVAEAEQYAVQPEERARLLDLRGRIEHRVGTFDRACALFLEAEDLIKERDWSNEADILSSAAVVAVGGCDLQLALDIAHRMRARTPGDESFLDAHADEMIGWVLSLSGQPAEARPFFERAVDVFLAPESPTWQALFIVSVSLRRLERIDEGDELARRVVQRARAIGPRALLSALELETLTTAQAGKWSVAVASAEEGAALAREIGHRDQRALLLVQLARIDACRGESERCRARLQEVAEIAEDCKFHLVRQQVNPTLGLLELGDQRLQSAIDHLEAAASELERVGLYDRDAFPHADLIEALVQAGRRDAADTVFARCADWMEAGSPHWGGALAARCSGLLAADGDFESHFMRALELQAHVRDNFQCARTLLCFGERLRRAGHKVEARKRLRGALELFDELQARPWSERARRELRATGERIRRARSVPGAELTSQELQVALQVGEGKTNKEAAAALFLSPKTIEFHLASVYRKLDVRSRHELIKQFSSDAGVLASA